MAITMYTTRWCPDCWRAKRFLRKHDVEVQEVDIDRDEEAARLVMRHNGGKRRVPTFEIQGEFYGNPPLHELERLLSSTA